MGTKTFKQTFPDFTAVNRAFATVCATSDPKLSTFFPLVTGLIVYGMSRGLF